VTCHTCRMSLENPPRRRARDSQDGIGSRAAVISAAVAVVLVAGGGWAIASAGNDDKTTGSEGASVTTPTAGATPSHATGHDHGSKDKPWSPQCGRAAKAAARAGYGVLAPSELPSGWTLNSCHYSSSTGWHVEFSAAHQTVTVDQRKGDVAPVVTAVLGPSSRQGKDVHAEGTGTWQSWATNDGRHALSRALSSSGVVLSGKVAVPTLNRLADVLLTYETAPSGNNGG
jgi:hypothetical protein